MGKQVEFEGRIHEFPDDASEEEIQRSLGGMAAQNNGVTINDAFNNYLKSSLSNQLGGIAQQSLNMVAPSLTGDFSQGFSEGIPASLASVGNAVGQLGGKEPFVESPEQPTQSFPRYAGRMLGKGAGYLGAAAPIIAGAEAAIPGLLGASVGSGIAGGLETKGDLQTRIHQALIDAAIPSLAKGASAILRLGKSAVSSVKPRKAADVIQKAHDVSEAQATEPFKQASKIAEERAIPAVKIDKSVVDLAKRAFPKIKSYKDLIKEAMSGNYESLRQLSSDMKKTGRSLDNSDKLLTEQKFGRELQEGAEKIDKTMQKQYVEAGHKDLASMMEQGINKYAKHKDLYYSNPTISKLVGEEKKVPKNLVKTVGQDWAYFKKLREAHPELKSIIQRQEDKAFLKKLGIGGIGFSELSRLHKDYFRDAAGEND